MNWKQQRLEELQKELDDSEEWILNNWMELPKSVRSIIAYGLNSTKETIKELKK
ncbi:hypothetical protein HMPREF1013_00874 [Bacillus sp. 2_A_57_CT2]|nr:hypothetical protein HMPREF1013_00874 [Bacillus sp. 2_A_57_CT2]